MPASNNIFTVSQLNRHVRQLLETEMGTIWLTGEISNLSIPSSGHWYFSLKDDNAQIKCAMFKGNNRMVRFKPEHGAQVLIRARISLYEPRGDFQVIAELMEPAGEGLLQQQFLALKSKLQQQGWFDPRHKQPLPSYPKRVGLITSATGAALHDMLSILKRRSPNTELVIYPTLVQGETAAQAIADAIHTANRRNEVEVLVVGRGGGSMEDLWCFNEELVAHAIFMSQIPIISAVGHETDVTIADFVADLRAATPSAAAELLCQDAKVHKDQLNHLLHRLVHAVKMRLGHDAQQFLVKLESLKSLHPQRHIEKRSQYLDELNLRLQYAMKQFLQGCNSSLERTHSKLTQASPMTQVTRRKADVAHLSVCLVHQMQDLLVKKRHQIGQLSGELNIASPLATLSRGYSITQHIDGKVIKSINQIEKNDLIMTQLGDGQVESKVVTVDPS